MFLIRLCSCGLLLVVSACNQVNLSSNTTDKDTLMIAAAPEDSVSVVHAPATHIKASVELQKTMRMDLAQFGCWMEQNFGHVDSAFNCSTKEYENRGDPCERTDEYYQKVEFPSTLFKKVHPGISHIQVDFEHGNLREMVIQFAMPVSIQEINLMFALTPDNLPENVMYIDYDDDGSGRAQKIVLAGFEHIGAADVEC
jgi:hypothetical protein